MRKSIPLAIVATAGLAFGATAIATPDELTRAEQRAERLLAGKTAGEPMQCIRRNRLRNSTVPNPSEILYRQNSQLVYRTRIEGGCPGLTDDRSIILRSISQTHVCSGDQIEVVDNQTGVEYGRCAISEFVPYRTP